MYRLNLFIKNIKFFGGKFWRKIGVCVYTFLYVKKYQKRTVWAGKLFVSILWIISVIQFEYQIPNTNMHAQWAYGFIASALMVQCIPFIMGYPTKMIVSYLCTHSLRFKKYFNTHIGTYE